MNIRSEADIDIEPEKSAPNQEEWNNRIVLPAPGPAEQRFRIERLQTLCRLFENQKRRRSICFAFHQLPSGYRPLVRMQRLVEIDQRARRIFPAPAAADKEKGR